MEVVSGLGAFLLHIRVWIVLERTLGTYIAALCTNKDFSECHFPYIYVDMNSTYKKNIQVGYVIS